ncbi:prephenate dehydrogenase/arogenate dehydrogenase family protein [Camelimonas abortus]|uniref:Prephenate dehydrogenase/arogenate dehydrogenase family protein n=1 Tax=Camelimonas abortus TaxID=1017184 RepID=A0ABV7LD83_9HYPH
MPESGPVSGSPSPRPAASGFATVGLVGFGAFGRLIVRCAPPGARFLVHDPRPLGETGANVAAASLAEVAACPLVVLAAPVDATAGICRLLAPHLRPGTLVTDVGSVKVKPAAAMLDNLPAHVEVAGLHPLFGPQSAAGGVAGLRLVVCPLRGRRVMRLAALLRRACGLVVLFATPEEHDREMAMVQGVTHMVGRLVAELDPAGDAARSRMATRSFSLLMQAVEMVRHDDPAVFDAIVLRNPHVAGVQDRFFEAAAALRRRIRAGRRAQLRPSMRRPVQSSFS